jgi:hypothetical protein
LCVGCLVVVFRLLDGLTTTERAFDRRHPQTKTKVFWGATALGHPVPERTMAALMSAIMQRRSEAQGGEPWRGGVVRGAVRGGDRLVRGSNVTGHKLQPPKRHAIRPLVSRPPRPPPQHR